MSEPDGPVAVRGTVRMLVEDRLGEPLDEFVAACRPDMSWRLIAAELTRRTGIDLAPETVWRWFA